MFEPDIQMRMSGPMLNGSARRALHRYTEEAQDEIALQYGITVVGYMRQFFKHPTPYYWTRVQVERQGNDRVITDSGVIYGPWLAGMSSRNQTTRFKGYAHWRLASQKLRRQAPGIAMQLLRRYLQQMGGKS